MRLLGLVLGLICLCACGPKASAPEAKRGALRYAVEVATVGEQPFQRTISATGTLAAFETVRLSARVAGVIDRVLVAEGDVVAEGQAVAEIDADRFNMSLAQAEAQLVRAQVTKADAERSLVNREKLMQQQIVSQDEVDRERLRLAQAGADVGIAIAARDRAQLDVRDAQVVSPIAGIVQSRLAETGMAVQPGTPLATVLRRDPLLVRFSVTVEDAAWLKAGQLVTVAVRGNPTQHQATISLVSTAASEDSRMVLSVARVTDSSVEGLRPGAFCTVTIPVQASRPMVVVPDIAVRASDQGFLVHVVEDAADGPVARARLVTLGGRDGLGMVEVIAGLKSGERLIVRGAEAVRDGVSVNLAPQAK